MLCQKCQNEIVDNSSFCNHCGAKQEPQKPPKNLCINCGEELISGSSFCNHCGASQKKEEPPKPLKNVCLDCGEELISGSSFCNHCGASQKKEEEPPKATAVPKATASSISKAEPKPAEAPAAPKKEEKKSNLVRNIIIIVAVLAIAGGVGKAIGSSMGKDLANSKENDQTITSQSDVLDDAYSQIFNSRGIVDDAPTFVSGAQSACYALADSDGIVYKVEFIYRGDRVERQIFTWYYPYDYVETYQNVINNSYELKGKANGNVSVYSEVIIQYHKLKIDMSNINVSSVQNLLKEYDLYLGSSFSEIDSQMRKDGAAKK